jgi:hypothetical protein
MKKLPWCVLLSILSLSGAALAQDEDEAATAPPTQQMQARMQAMREQMQAIHATEDPEERQRLMLAHMQSMHEGMTMMGEMMRGPMAGTQSQQCAAGDTECRMNQMQTQQQMMGQRMGMMQQMMQQMMEQMLEQQGASSTQTEDHEEHH